jgi:hypothetical protein
LNKNGEKPKKGDKLCINSRAKKKSAKKAAEASALIRRQKREE